MTRVLLPALIWGHHGFSPDALNAQAELQGLYDEISHATLQFATESDVDLFHDVIYTSDWVLVDQTGQRETWPQVRARVVQALMPPRLDWMMQPIQKLALAPGRAVS